MFFNGELEELKKSYNCYYNVKIYLKNNSLLYDKIKNLIEFSEILYDDIN